MLVGIHYNPYGIFSEFLVKFEQILDFNEIDHIRMEASQADFWDIIPKLDLFIYHWGHNDAYKERAETILPIIEKHYGIPVLPNQATCWHYDDKIKQYYLLKKYGFPLVESDVFWEKKPALEWAKNAIYPQIFKLKRGAGSNSVIKVNKDTMAIKLINKMFGSGMQIGKIPSYNSLRYKDYSFYRSSKRFLINICKRLLGREIHSFWQVQKNYAYFQKFYPDNKWDTRVTVIGDKIYAFRRFVRENDFRASGSDKWSLDRDKIDRKFLELSLKISDTMEFQVIAYDWIYDENMDPRLIEISYTYGDYPEFSNGYWDREFNWHPGKYSTQYFELMYALKKYDLKNLELNPIGHYAQVKVKV